MEFPIKVIVVLIIVGLVLVVMNSLLLGQTGKQFTQAEALRVFNTQCAAYREQRCDWSVTKDASFDSFLQACRTLYGLEREALSCLYSLCQDCKTFDPRSLACEGRCKLCEGSKKLGIDTTDCCTIYANECQGTCDACAP
ncbi:MAG: hypothetical protein HY832_02265 [Candidatus Aenigmarchaeota archaeon]|nr:hypothetical protein [Candidatus Aenigmarchaeota archaeon]